MSRYFISKILALSAGIILLIVAYFHNQNSIFIISGEAYGTSWSVSSSEYIGDHHDIESTLEFVRELAIVP